MVSLAGRDAATAEVRGRSTAICILLRAIVGISGPPGEYGLPDVVGRFRSSKRFTVFAFVEKPSACLRADGKLGTARNYRRTLNSFSGFLNNADIPFSLLDERLVKPGITTGCSGDRLYAIPSLLYAGCCVPFQQGDPVRGIVPQALLFRNVYTGVDRTRKRAVGEERPSYGSGVWNLEHSPHSWRWHGISLFSAIARGEYGVRRYRLPAQT